MQKSKQEWSNQGRKNSIIYIFYENHVIDATQFKKVHPGGQIAIKNYAYKDVTSIMYNVYPHPVTAKVILLKYSVGTIPKQEISAKERYPNRVKTYPPLLEKKVSFQGDQNIKRQKMQTNIPKILDIRVRMPEEVTVDIENLQQPSIQQSLYIRKRTILASKNIFQKQYNDSISQFSHY